MVDKIFEPVKIVGMVYNNEKKEVYISHITYTEIINVSNKNKFDIALRIDNISYIGDVLDLINYIGFEPIRSDYIDINNLIMNYVNNNIPGVYAMQPIREIREK